MSGLEGLDLYFFEEGQAEQQAIREAPQAAREALSLHQVLLCTVSKAACQCEVKGKDSIAGAQGYSCHDDLAVWL